MELRLKRGVDILLSLGLLIIILPFFLIIALIICIELGGDVFFKQWRPGKMEKCFLLVKFKTMLDKTDAHGNLLPDDLRLTRLGRFLRKWSIDELPELWNTLKGDMSLVGPRPLLFEYLGLYSQEQSRRHILKPGITGWAQVNGRNAITWEEKFRYDVWYVENWSMRLDMKILGLTLIKAVKREGISHPGYATMEKFRGTGDGEGRTIQEAAIAKD